MSKLKISILKILLISVKLKNTFKKKLKQN